MRTSTRCDTSAVCLLAAALLTLALVEWPRAQAAPGALRRAELPVRGRYIVRVRSGFDPDALANMTQALGRGRVRHIYRQAFRGFAIEASEPAALALASDPAVAYVEEDAVVRATGEQSLQEDDSWGLDRIDQRIMTSGVGGGYDHVYHYAAEGDGVNVYVVDTGVRTTHDEFAGRALAAFDARPSERIAGDCNGHGTHVAAVVGGTRFGVAKQVTIHSVRVTGCDGRGSVSDLIAAIDWITANHLRPAVINMSLEGGASDAFNESARAAVNAGITFVAAAGNGGVDACRGLVGGVPELIVAGATDAGDSRLRSSNYGRCLDVFAPGGNISSAFAGSDRDRATLSGTSMASAHVAGAAALYLQRNPKASPARVASAITSEATTGVVRDAGRESPNRLLFTPRLGETAPPAQPSAEPGCVTRSNTVEPLAGAPRSCSPGVTQDSPANQASPLLADVAVAAGTGTVGGSPISYMCDPDAGEYCTTFLVQKIRAETRRIDVAEWIITDPVVRNELVARWRAGVPVRVLFDPTQASTLPVMTSHKNNGEFYIRKKSGGPAVIAHQKFLIFDSQNFGWFGSGNLYDLNYNGGSMVDELIFGTTDSSLVNSMRRRFDDLWIDSTVYADFSTNLGPAGSTIRGRAYSASLPLDSRFHWGGNDFFTRLAADIDRETIGLYISGFRTRSEVLTTAVERAARRGVTVRILSDSCETYHQPGKAINAWTSNFVDRVYAAGARVRMKRYFTYYSGGVMRPACQLNHQKTTVLIGLHKVYNGSQIYADQPNLDINYISDGQDTFDRTRTRMEAKWADSRKVSVTYDASGATRVEPVWGDLVPLPPDVPWSLAVSSSTTPRISWQGGQWAHKYDIDIGRGSCASPGSAIIAERNLSAPGSHFFQSFDWKTPTSGEIGEWYQVTAPLAASTTHYARITSKTAAGQSRSACLTFTTPGGTPADLPNLTRLSAVADVRLEQKNPQGAYATAPYLYGAGNVNGQCQLAEALMKWDVSTLRGKAIVTANLKFNITSTSASGQFALFRVNRAWTESGANWLQYAPGLAWDTPGANGANDRGSTVRGSFTGAPTTGTLTVPLPSAGLTLIHEWADGITANQGVLFRPTLNAPCTAASDDVGFTSKDGGIAPILEVTYR